MLSARCVNGFSRPPGDWIWYLLERFQQRRKSTYPGIRWGSVRIISKGCPYRWDLSAAWRWHCEDFTSWKIYASERKSIEILDCPHPMYRLGVKEANKKEVQQMDASLNFKALDLRQILLVAMSWLCAYSIPRSILAAHVPSGFRQEHRHQ